VTIDKSHHRTKTHPGIRNLYIVLVIAVLSFIALWVTIVVQDGYRAILDVYAGVYGNFLIVSPIILVFVILPIAKPTVRVMDYFHYVATRNGKKPRKLVFFLPIDKHKARASIRWLYVICIILIAGLITSTDLSKSYFAPFEVEISKKEIDILKAIILEIDKTDKPSTCAFEAEGEKKINEQIFKACAIHLIFYYGGSIRVIENDKERESSKAIIKKLKIELSRMLNAESDRPVVGRSVVGILYFIPVFFIALAGIHTLWITFSVCLIFLLYDEKKTEGFGYSNCKIEDTVNKLIWIMVAYSIWLFFRLVFLGLEEKVFLEPKNMQNVVSIVMFLLAMICLLYIQYRLNPGIIAAIAFVAKSSFVIYFAKLIHNNWNLILEYAWEPKLYWALICIAVVLGVLITTGLVIKRGNENRTAHYN